MGCSQIDPKEEDGVPEDAGPATPASEVAAEGKAAEGGAAAADRAVADGTENGPVPPPEKAGSTRWANKASAAKKKAKQPQTRIELLHCDIIKDEFWDTHAGILAE